MWRKQVFAAADDHEMNPALKGWQKKPLLILSFLTAFLTLTLWFKLVSATPATTLTEVLCVKPGGGDGCYSSISDALDAAIAGDMIKVAAGSYTENLVVTYTVHLQGGWSTDFAVRDLDVYTTTIYPADVSQSVVTIYGDFANTAVVTPTLDGFFITGGRADLGSNHGGGLQIRDSDAVVISNTISGNRAFFLGGGIWVQRGAPLIQGNSILENYSVGLGQNSYGGGIQLENTQATLIDNLIAGNIVSGTQAYGGGVEISNTGSGQVVLQNNQLISNTASVNTLAIGIGGAIAVNGGQVMVEDNLVLSNTAVTAGGGIYFTNSTVQFLDNGVISNTASTGGGVFLDGGFADCCSYTGDNNLISKNSAISGGGIYIGGYDDCCSFTATNMRIGYNQAAEGGGLYNFNQSIMISNTIISRNDALAGGGGLLIGAGGSISIPYSALVFNQAGQDGGAILNSGNFSLTNSTISGNTADGMGGGIANFSVMNLRNTTIADNTSPSGAGMFNANTANVVNSLVAENTGDNCLGAMNSLGYNLEDGFTCAFGQPTDLPNTEPSINPLVNYSGQTYAHPLNADSPAIDAGDNTDCSPFDQRGVPRPLDGDDDGIAVCDIGAYEYDGTADTSMFLYLPTVLK